MFKKGDIVKFRRDVIVSSSGSVSGPEGSGSYAIHTDDNMEVVYTDEPYVVSVMYLTNKLIRQSVYPCEIELAYQEVKYNPNQMVDDEDDL